MLFFALPLVDNASFCPSVGVEVVHATPWPIEAAINSLLRTAARLELEELVFALPPELVHNFIRIDLQCFQRATSIVVDSSVCFLHVSDDIKFPVIETLSLSHCHVHLDTLLPCFP